MSTRPEFHLSPARAQVRQADHPPFRVWDAPNGSRWLEFFRIRKGYLLRFPGLGDFELSTDGQVIQGWPVPEASAAMFEHLYRNQVVPLALSRQGRLVLHASAVETELGAIAFAGPTGFGKSTLAASFASTGSRFLTDDGLPIGWDGEHLAALPGDPSIRLLDDSCQAILGGTEGANDSPDHGGKTRFLAGPRTPHADRPLPLLAIFFLSQGGADEPTIESVSPAHAVMALVRNSFLLDVEESEHLATHFSAISRIATLPIHRSLDYPRDFAELPRVREAIAAHLRAGRPR